jgi:hypothetical protein
VLSEEATCSAALARIKEEQAPETPDEVEQYINDTAAQMGLAQEWRAGQALVRDTKGKEREFVKRAIKRYRKRDIDFEE